MSGSMNKAILIGNLGRDPELKMTPAGQALARFSVATTETWKGQDGNKQSKTEWHNCVVWGKQAEIAEKYLRKGQQVMVEGRIQYNEYTDQAGVKKTACNIRVDHFVMLGKKEDNGGRDSYGTDGAGGDPMPPPPAAGSTYDDSDIPF